MSKPDLPIVLRSVERIHRQIWKEGRMTTIFELITELRSKGATLRASGKDLKIEAPRGVVTPEIREFLTDHKPEVIAQLHRDTYTRTLLRRMLMSRSGLDQRYWRDDADE